MSTSLFYDRRGQPITAEQWLDLIEGRRYKRVAEHNLGAITIITIWLGLDAFALERPGDPVIFETLVFDTEDHGIDDVYRYSTEEEAIAGHVLLVDRYRGNGA